MTWKDDGRFRHSGGYMGWCVPCGKKTYATRKDARRAGRDTNNGHMQAYACPAADVGWHCGHTAEAVIRGWSSRADLFRWRRGGL